MSPKKRLRTKLRNCEQCNRALPQNAHQHQRYCSGRSCKDKAYRERKAARQSRLVTRAHPEIYRDLMKVIGKELEGAEDPVVEFRALFTEAMRENIHSKVSDGMLGAAETVMHLVPKALAVVAADLDSDDPLEKARAAQFLLKYAINFKEAPTDDSKKNETITIVADRVMAPGQVVYQAPDTQFGREYLDEVEARHDKPQLDPGELEECYKCHERKARGAMHIHDDQGPGRWICKACHWTKMQNQRKTVDVTPPDLIGDF